VSKRYEYKKDIYIEAYPLEDVLNKEGGEGWRAIKVEGNELRGDILFEREIIEQDTQYTDFLRSLLGTDEAISLAEATREYWGRDK